LMILSRAELQAGRPEAAAQLAEEAYGLAPSTLSAINLGSVLTLTGNLRRASALVRSVDPASVSPVIGEIALAIDELVQLSVDGDLASFVRHVEEMAERQREQGYIHYAGISFLNGALALRAQGDANKCLSLANAAIDALTESSAPAELVSARLARDWALAHLGRPRDPLDVGLLTAGLDGDLRAEAACEAAFTAIWYGNADAAERLLAAVDVRAVRRADITNLVYLARLELALRLGSVDRARASANQLADDEHSAEPAHRAHQLAVRAYLAMQEGDRTREFLSEGARLANQQRSFFWVAYTDLLAFAETTTPADPRALPSSVVTDTAYLSVLAEVVCHTLSAVQAADAELIRAEVLRRPARWRDALRTVARSATSPSRWEAAGLLDEAGDESDVRLLRTLARAARAGTPERGLGRALARQLAPRVLIEDQGRVALLVGDRRIDGSTLRRKVLALLCLLLTRPDFAATRDEVLDALWPDLEPEIAVNSLNQTVYFLRRVFEPQYSEQTSPGFVHFDSNVLWIDSELVTSRSQACGLLMRRIATEATAEDVDELAGMYKARFALDFAYEEWAIPFRDSMHAAYLQIMESAIASDLATGHFERGIRLARAALAVDPSAEGLEVFLVRLYRLSGAHAAAAEQYEHYAAMVREELGVDPPPLEAV
jgi:DNA-binding SARP family transcriptional activator